MSRLVLKTKSLKIMAQILSCCELLHDATTKNSTTSMNMSFRSEVMKGFSTFKKSDLKSERKKELKSKLLSKFPLLEKTMSFKASLKFNFRV